MPLQRQRLLRRLPAWTFAGGTGVYALAWVTVSGSILGMSAVARVDDSLGHRTPLPGVGNFARVDDRVLRGAAPSAEGYRRLAGLGVVTVVDLRAERPSAARAALPGRAGLAVVGLPIRDGQPPSAGQVDRFMTVVHRARGRVFVHCGAGVGRTGSMAAAYLVRTGQADARTATRRSLAVGPPSLEQVAFMRRLNGDRVRRPPAPVVALSRLADSPRRFWSRLTHP
ncbi:protein-tyrosine phosphatase family protein [Thermomonospora umbrina]|uniref:Dual specificity protein phosphatase-like protein n=1 Tax=Thermomonospora umbrina TaxID=111806 RepID=A0A3D9SGP2_9ACTN|nr:dual specificity protein phosphatase family protein [Thermomonospora umbrina]REE94857.1 dual specificity protein phosphatase-like protein [Thermomonospora umbrina]